MYLRQEFPPMDSIMRLLTVWRITGKIIRMLKLLLLHMHYQVYLLGTFWGWLRAHMAA